MGWSEKENTPHGRTVCRSYGYQVKDIDHSSDQYYNSCSAWHTCEGHHWYQNFPISFMMETHVNAVTRKKHDVLWCHIIEKHVIGLGNSLGVNIGRLSKDCTI